MDWHPIIPIPDDSWGSNAYDTLGKNIGRLGSMLDFLSENVSSLTADYRVLSDSLEKAREQLRQSRNPEAGREALAKADDLARKSKTFQEVTDLLNEWHIVMGVTMVETYLEDVLADAAVFDQSLMARSEQSVRYEDTLRADSLQDLQREIRHRWSRNFVDDGGPVRWAERLERMGARCIAAELAMQLEEFWGIRHVVVHAAGRVPADFVRRHPNLRSRVGDQVGVTDDELVSFSKLVVEFAICVDRFLCARCPSLKRSSVAV